jgi:hypothetical protein
MRCIVSRHAAGASRLPGCDSSASLRVMLVASKRTPRPKQEQQCTGGSTVACKSEGNIRTRMEQNTLDKGFGASEAGLDEVVFAMRA